MASFPQSLGQMTAHERQVANLRYRTRNFTISLLSLEGQAEGSQGRMPSRWAIYGPWWAYVSRADAGLECFDTDEPYAFYGHELGDALEVLNATWDFSVPERYRDKPKAALEALSRATDKSAEDLGL